MERISILIADQHQVRTQIAARLTREPAFDIVAVADSSALTLRRANESHPRLILIDPHMDDAPAMSTIRRLRAEVPDSAIVVLSAVTDTAQKIELEKLGVQFILNKGIESFKLVAILHQAAGAANGLAADVVVNEPLNGRKETHD